MQANTVRNGIAASRVLGSRFSTEESNYFCSPLISPTIVKFEPNEIDRCVLKVAFKQWMESFAASGCFVDLICRSIHFAPSFCLAFIYS